MNRRFPHEDVLGFDELIDYGTYQEVASPTLMHRLSELHDVMWLLQWYQVMVDDLFQDMPRLVQFWRGHENNDERRGRQCTIRYDGGQVRRWTVHSNLQGSLLQLPLPVRLEGTSGRCKRDPRVSNMHPHLDFGSLQTLRLVSREFECDSWVAFLLEAEVNLYRQRERRKMWIADRSNKERLCPFWHLFSYHSPELMSRAWAANKRMGWPDATLAAECRWYYINHRYPRIDLYGDGVDQVGRLLIEGFRPRLTLIWHGMDIDFEGSEWHGMDIDFEGSEEEEEDEDEEEEDEEQEEEEEEEGAAR